MGVQNAQVCHVLCAGQGSERHRQRQRGMGMVGRRQCRGAHASTPNTHISNVRPHPFDPCRLLPHHAACPVENLDSRSAWGSCRNPVVRDCVAVRSILGHTKPKPSLPARRQGDTLHESYHGTLPPHRCPAGARHWCAARTSAHSGHAPKAAGGGWRCCGGARPGSTGIAIHAAAAAATQQTDRVPRANPPQTAYEGILASKTMSLGSFK